MGDAIKGMLVGRHAAGRLGRAGEVAEMVRFLAGEESSFCFGEILTVTGGYTG
jgi:NAD(P)-dependent dehydrogenase (short-subunit alcohol dehydrogenase family)